MKIKRILLAVLAFCVLFMAAMAVLYLGGRTTPAGALAGPDVVSPEWMGTATASEWA